MEMWETIWAWVLIIVVVIFSAVAVGVTFGGFRDVKAMFSTIDSQHEADRDADQKIP